jgi:serine O-acetyltransferase
MVFKRLQEDLDAFMARDPAARSRIEVALCYPGFHALLFFRASGALWRRRFFLVARMVSHLGRLLTSIEIHPGANIGRRLVIDHGTGVVIGETAEIGDRVTLYQGVTLGGTGFARGKRHPTLDDDVTVGSGAKLLGPVTVGRNAKVGANTVVIEDVPPLTTVVGNPGHPVRVEGRPVEGPDTDWIHLPDPIAEAMKELSERITALEKRLADATGEDAGEADVTELRPKKGPSSAGG